MGCIIKHNINESTILGVWRIEETLDTLSQMVTLDPDEKKRFKGFRSSSRKLEFLSVRALLPELIGNKTKIVYNKNNKPFLKDGSMFISISHSHQLTAIMLSVNEKVGLDLEYMRSNIASVALKFMNIKEKITKDPASRIYHLYLHWCAKEALYKICDKEDINFQENLTIKPFEVDVRGDITGIVHNNFRNEEYKMHYMLENNYVLVYCTKSIDN